MGMEQKPLWLPVSKLKKYKLPDSLPASWSGPEAERREIDSPFAKRALSMDDKDAKEVFEFLDLDQNEMNFPFAGEPLGVDITVENGFVDVTNMLTDELSCLAPIVRKEDRWQFVAKSRCSSGHVPLDCGTTTVLNHLNCHILMSLEMPGLKIILSNKRETKEFEFSEQPTHISVIYNRVNEKERHRIRMNAIVISMTFPLYSASREKEYVVRSGLCSERVKDDVCISKEVKLVKFNIHIDSEDFNKGRSLIPGLLYDVLCYA